MKVTDDQISSIVDRVVEQISGKVAPSVKKEAPRPQATSSTPAPSYLRGCFNDIEESTLAAEKAFHQFQEVSLKKRKEIIEAIRQIARDNIQVLSRMALEETGLGRYEDKIRKNSLAIEKTPGVEDIETASLTGDNGLTLFERAPFGVIGSITPTTNPTETIISNGIAMIAGGNSVSFHPHPSAKKCSAFTVDLLNKAVISAGGPPNLFTTVANPTIKSAQALMVHPKIALLVVTGGPAVVAQAMKSGKKVVGAGPGNPPVVVDETADLEQAASDIIRSASTDNNIICLIEKEIIVVNSVADEFKKYLIKHGAVELGAYQAKRLEKIIVEDGHPNKNFVGKDIQVILKQIDMEVDPSKRIAITETGPDHPFAVHELLMPVLPFIRVKNIDEAIEVAYKLENQCFHTAVIHSKNVDNMHKMAKKMNTAIFVKNGPALAGLGFEGEGPASFTIAAPTGEGVTTARHFTKMRRCVLSGPYRIV